jgi:hypothetical protein
VMSERRRVTRADIQAKLRQIHESLADLVQRAKRVAKMALAPAGSALLVMAYLRGRRKKRRTIIEVRRA